MTKIQMSKRVALENFVKELRDRFGDKIWGIYLFGSTAKGTASSESDIDVLIVYSKLDERHLLEVASEISFDIAVRTGQLIEIVSMSKKEYQDSIGRSPFLWEVLEFGSPVFTRLKGTEWKLDFKEYLKLAEEFLGYARDALKENKLRLAIDTGYNAAELLVKALIISTKTSLASSHGGVVGQFGKLFILNKKLPQILGRNLNLGLDLRAKARYKPTTELNRQDAEFMVDLVEELLKIARKALSD